MKSIWWPSFKSKMSWPNVVPFLILYLKYFLTVKSKLRPVVTSPAWSDQQRCKRSRIDEVDQKRLPWNRNLLPGLLWKLGQFGAPREAAASAHQTAATLHGKAQKWSQNVVFCCFHSSGNFCPGEFQLSIRVETSNRKVSWLPEFFRLEIKKSDPKFLISCVGSDRTVIS